MFVHSLVPSIFQLGVRFDQWSLHALVNYLFSINSGSVVVVTPNVDHIVRCHNDAEFARLYGEADISLNDSRVLALLFKMAGLEQSNVIPGSDLTAALFEGLKENKAAIAILGCDSSVIDVIEVKYGLTQVAHYNPPMGFIESEIEIERCLSFLKENENKLLFLAVGSPRQEVLAFRAARAGIEGVFLCVGASLLFLSGHEVRAPRVFQLFAMEWLFRLLQSPSRMARRYLIDGIKIFSLVYAERRKKRAG